MLERFFERTMKSYLMITGLLTATAFSTFLAPDWSMQTLFSYNETMMENKEYLLGTYQHWGGDGWLYWRAVDVLCQVQVTTYFDHDLQRV